MQITTTLTRDSIANVAEFEDLATIPVTTEDNVYESALVTLVTPDWTAEVVILTINDDGTMELSFLDYIY